MLDAEKLEEFVQELLFPESFKHFEDFRNGLKLAHYTTAENGLNIINGRQVWMRHSSVMNDFMELDHGTACLVKAIASPEGEAFKKWIDGIHPDFMESVWKWFRDGSESLIRNNTYLTSVALHPASEDRYGRLSMWRAYGGRNGVALVVNPTAFMSDDQSLGAFSTPVLYLDEEAFIEWFTNWSQRLIENEALLKAFPVDDLRGWIVTSFRMNILATKHPGFAEEQEWRVYHTQELDEQGELAKDFVTIGGVPQPIMKIPLSAGLGNDGVALRELLHRVIIGPSEHSLIIARAYAAALEGAGFEDPWSMITVSNIPLRN